VGAVTGIVQFAVGLWWMHEFTLPGYILCTLLEASFFTLVVTAVHPRKPWTVPAALLVAEAARGFWPFGGLPLGGAALGQVGGPLAPAARVGGELLIVALIGVGGVAVFEATRRRWWPAVVSLLVVVAGAGAGVVSPSGTAHGTGRIVAVQGGGPRGLRAIHGDPGRAFAAQVRASPLVRPPVDVVLWPEDVVDVDAIEGSPEATAIAGLARSFDATVIAGVVEDDGVSRFRNAAIAWAPSGEIAGRYDKVHRVPFGEFIPLRSLVRHFGNVDAVPRDATAGRGPGVLPSRIGRLGVVISYEVFFADRARAATRPVVGCCSYLPTRRRSRPVRSPARSWPPPVFEPSRPAGRRCRPGRRDTARPSTTLANVLHRSALGRPTVVPANVTLRSGSTPATALGPWPFVLLAVAMLALGRLDRVVK